MDIPGFLYAGLVSAGGVFGYYKAGSVPSLAAGLIFGGALAYGAFETSRDPSNYTFQLATTSILAGVMGYRYYNSGKIMPAGAVCLLSVAMILRIAGRASGLTGPRRN
ncbi:transmembrane protein 14C [Diorhabda carinulata]|uniref:transmembrane protein 14C n=1 Tax=Diorhabda sublineata TaxID=1163346 RepID=UPI0024E181C1|nr:transmembrane protein 14C [Diorhabda sublineata]XP_057663356.1 transmembrane protein 14C [Diorhabda carinulata]